MRLSPVVLTIIMTTILATPVTIDTTGDIIRCIIKYYYFIFIWSMVWITLWILYYVILLLLGQVKVVRALYKYDAQNVSNISVLIFHIQFVVYQIMDLTRKQGFPMMGLGWIYCVWLTHFKEILAFKLFMLKQIH